MQAIRHQKMTMQRALSEETRADMQTARHTSQLHSTARANRLAAVPFILCEATVMSRPCGSSSSPPPPPMTDRPASTAVPHALPIQLTPRPENALAQLP